MPADTTKLQRVYVMAPPTSAAAEDRLTDIEIWVEDTVSGERVFKETVFNGKGAIDTGAD